MEPCMKLVSTFFGVNKECASAYLIVIVELGKLNL